MVNNWGSQPPWKSEGRDDENSVQWEDATTEQQEGPEVSFLKKIFIHLKILIYVNHN